MPKPQFLHVGISLPRGSLTPPTFAYFCSLSPCSWSSEVSL
jgi:hypothetical protein